MPKMIRWDHPEPIDVPSAKAAVYAAQGWVSVDAKPRKVQPAIVRETMTLEEPAPVKPAKKAAAKKTAAKKTSN